VKEASESLEQYRALWMRWRRGARLESLLGENRDGRRKMGRE
jgi:hypothetical protein